MRRAIGVAARLLARVLAPLRSPEHRALLAEVDRLRAEMTALRSDLGARLDQLESDSDQANRRCGGTEAGLDIHEARLVRVERRATAYEFGLASLGVEVERLAPPSAEAATDTVDRPRSG